MDMEMEAWEIIYDTAGGILDFRFIDFTQEILCSKYNEHSPHKVYYLYANKEAQEKNKYRLLFEGQIIKNYLPKH